MKDAVHAHALAALVVALLTGASAARASDPALPGVAGIEWPGGLSVGGYGEAVLARFDRTREDGAPSTLESGVDLLRQVVSVGYRFAGGMRFDSALELEYGDPATGDVVDFDLPGVASGGSRSGGAGLGFAYLEWQTRRDVGLRAGVITLPLGLLNETPQPLGLIGTRRPGVETFIIPTLWRGTGAGAFGRTPGGFDWRVDLVEGLDAKGFSASDGIRPGRPDGTPSFHGEPALAARLDWRGGPGMRVGTSWFTGNSWPHPQPPGASLRARVTLYDMHGTLDWRGFQGRALYAVGRMDQAEALSDALGLTGTARLGEHFFGGYVESTYDVLPWLAPATTWALLPTARFEEYDTQEGVTIGIEDPAQHHTVISAGLAVKPRPSVVVRADREYRHNEARTETRRWNLALAYEF